MEIKWNDIIFWVGMIRFIIVGAILIVLAANLTFFSEVFKSVEPEVIGILLWVLFILFALQRFQPPHFKKPKTDR